MVWSRCLLEIIFINKESVVQKQQYYLHYDRCLVLFDTPSSPKFPSRLMGLSGDRWSSAKLVKLDICFAEAQLEWRRRDRQIVFSFSSPLVTLHPLSSYILRLFRVCRDI